MTIVIEKMTTATVPIGNYANDIIVEGNDFEREWDFKDNDGNLFDFTGYTGTAQVRDADGALIATFTVAALSATGIVNISLTALPDAGEYFYDIVITAAGSVEKTLQRGAFHVSARYTPAT